MAKRAKAEPLPSVGSVQATDLLAQKVVRWIKVVAWFMGLTVVGYELINAPLSRIAEDLDNSGLIKIGLVIFFFGWLWGATADTEIQRLGYCADPDDAKLGWKEIGGIFAFVAVFITLFITHDNPVWFQSVLLIFIIVNFCTWRIIIERTEEIITASIAAFEAREAESSANCALAKLLTVVQYMNGPWQRYRFWTLIGLAALQVVVAVLSVNGLLVPLGNQFRLFDISGGLLAGYLPGLLFILYVLVSEIWMKLYRVKLFAELNMIDFVERNFTISKRRGGPRPQPHLAGAFDHSPCANANYVGHGPVKWLIDFL